MKRCLVALVLLALAGISHAQTPSERGPLQPGVPREEDIAAGEEHVFSVPTTPGHAHEVRVEQLGLNAEVRWKAGAESRRVDRREGWSGTEIVWWVADGASPAATLTVRPSKQRGGRYRITSIPPRPADAADRERHEAEKALFGPPALDAVDSAARRFAALGLPERQVLALARLSLLAVNLGEVPRARQAGEECVAVARAAAPEEDLAKCLLALASSLVKAGERAGAEAAFVESLRIREGRGDPGPIAIVLHDWTNLLIAGGEYDRADAQLRRVMALAETDGDLNHAAVAQSSLATMTSYRGDPEAALAAFEAALDVVRVHGRADQKAVLAINVGLAYGMLGDAERSIARLREGAALAEANALKPILAFARLAIAAEHDDLGDLTAAATEMLAAVKLAGEAGDTGVAADGEAHLGWVLARQGKLAAATEHAAAGVRAAATSGDAVRIATAALYQGKVLTTARRFAEAEPLLRQALDWFTATARVDDQAVAWSALARLAWERGDLTAALSHVEHALSGFESMRTQVALADRRAQYLSYRREAYDLAVGILLDADRRSPGQGHRAKAFEMTERARARSFLEEIARRHRGTAAEVPAELTRSHRAALDRLTHLQRELVARHTAAEPDRAAIAKLQQELEAAVSREEAARRALLEASPRGSEPVQVSVRAEEVAAKLSPDEAVLEYHVGADASWLFALTSEGLAVFPLPGERALRADVDALRALLARPAVLGASAYAAAAARLYAKVVAPAVPRLARVRRLRVVPDGPLWEVPFEALVTRPSAAGGYAGLPYALRRWQFVYHPSSSVLARSVATAPSPATPSAGLVAFANPLLTQGAKGPALARVERAVFREGDRWSLPPLPCAEREARQAAALFGARSRVFTGAEARESRVKNDPAVAGARYLLFSTHALLSETMPSQSSLVLNLHDDGPEDGLLQTHEIDALRLDADLVVLSACESALGRNLRGEGLLGLSRGFFHAGARSLVASLWKVSDCSTADLTTAFLSGLVKRGGGAGAALRDAKLGLLGNPAYAHPYYWAPFVLIGASADVTPARP